MSDCEQYQELLVGFVDRELSPAEETLVKKHLAECSACTGEVEELRMFARTIHNETVAFRNAAERIEKSVREQISLDRAQVKLQWFLKPAWIAVALLLVFSFAGLWMLQPTQKDEAVVAWGINHYPLVDQVHAISGDAATVRTWFREHHQIDVIPPRNADYSHLNGCKMTEYESQPVPLLRFEAKATTAVFILPADSVRSERNFSRDGYAIKLWKEGPSAYMAISPKL